MSVGKTPNTFLDTLKTFFFTIDIFICLYCFWCSLDTVNPGFVIYLNPFLDSLFEYVFVFFKGFVVYRNNHSLYLYIYIILTI